MVLYSSFVAPYYMKWLRNIQIIRIIRIIVRYSNIRIMIFKLWILFVIRFGHFLPTNIIRLFDSLQNAYSWQHCAWLMVNVNIWQKDIKYVSSRASFVESHVKNADVMSPRSVTKMIQLKPCQHTFSKILTSQGRSQVISLDSEVHADNV